MIQMKICTTCKEEKPITSYTVRKDRNSFTSSCKLCLSIKAAYYRSLKPKIEKINIFEHGVTQLSLRKCIDYNPETGEVRWKITVNNNKAIAGSVAGCIDTKGYVRIGLANQEYRMHRIIWLYMTGVLPDEVDHINHVRTDNRWCNLRAVSHKENCRNVSMSSINTSGITGVYYNKARSKWVAQIKIDQQVIYLGSFISIDDAIAARETAELKYDFHVNHGGKNDRL